MRSMRIGIRASLAFALLVALTIMLGLVSMLQMSSMNAAEDEISTNRLPSVMVAERLRAESSQMRVMTLRYALVDKELQAQTRESIQQARDRLATEEARYVKLISDQEEQRIFDAYRAEQAQYFKLSAQLISAVDSNDTPVIRMLVNTGLSDQAAKINVRLSELTERNWVAAEQATATGEQAYSNARLMVLGFLAAAVAVSVVLATLFTRSLVQPLKQAVAAARQIEGGDLTGSINDHGGDELAELLGSLDNMRNGLKNTVLRISRSATELSVASEQLSALTESSNSVIVRQNAEIEQAATAVNEMTSAVEDVASNAVSTSEASLQAKAATRNGSEAVKDTITQVSALKEDVVKGTDQIDSLANSITEISSVVSVIRSIAEQTNLLALNAAIEAARAGEQGRGFAVVADEVRALAHRTQVSTQEIENTIVLVQNGARMAVAVMQASQDRSNLTLEQANGSGEALKAVADTVTAINDRNLVIASAAEQQAQVAREVDRNLVNIRDLSMQTASAANQTESASKELANLAISLNNQIAHFRL